MLFIPYSDELKVINRIHKVRNEDYALLRLTKTMIEKNNPDANSIFRDLLLKSNLVDYDKLDFGGSNGITKDALFIQSDKAETFKLKFYKVLNKRGDCRFSIRYIKKKIKQNIINEGDLLYISVIKDNPTTPKLFIINLTSNPPTEEYLVDILGRDKINLKLQEILPSIEHILNGGFFDNSKGIGEISPKDIGDTFESLLNIKTNNFSGADIDGLIEIKTKGQGKTLDTLFTLRPNFEGTAIETIEPNDRNRVSAFTRLYGYDSDKHPGYNSLYITIGSKSRQLNNHNFFLDVDSENSRVNLKCINSTFKKNTGEIVAFWKFSELKERLLKKHPATLWINAISRKENDTYQFNYTDVEFSRSPQFTTFLSLIEEGYITYDWRGYTTKSGKYSGKNHGNAWRINPKYKQNLFGSIEKIEF